MTAQLDAAKLSYQACRSACTIPRRVSSVTHQEVAASAQEPRPTEPARFPQPKSPKPSHPSSLSSPTAWLAGATKAEAA
eukprot:CAMPEP_0172526660 /NCGR_PEP_ID=MMETSP1067-20121228/1521_1 /TAXON_ID=265564 ORGANISM="Thalassiosira punctigera, Strain Tpunct2005C2" /NCGR_SAMPLE_ID=MMETSP1067 /ASSEMBLY_ACC=CAM_ASM_000444 /LENGTH=78 /DNA_ID=CAMNT_0013310215 /DNA_START=96 /DNA_END=329 /DNA_ORIENTATION=+